MTQSTASATEQVTFNRAFELAVLELIKRGLVRCPTYLSLGAEHVPPAVLDGLGGERWPLFAQHRCHSWCLTWGMSPGAILDQLIGGVQGSASLADRQANVFGHDGFLGSNAPIAVGFAQATKRPVVCVLGDGACEEDHVLGALGQAASVKAPVLFVVEDNGLSVATEKRQRRGWSIKNLARSLGLLAGRPDADGSGWFGPSTLASLVEWMRDSLPALIEVPVTRLCAHNSTRDQSCSVERNEAVESMVDSILQRRGVRP